jgi:hypothetical protein
MHRAGVKALTFGDGGNAIAVGDQFGGVYVLRLLNVKVAPALLTLVRLKAMWVTDGQPGW